MNKYKKIDNVLHVVFKNALALPKALITAMLYLIMFWTFLPFLVILGWKYVKKVISNN